MKKSLGLVIAFVLCVLGARYALAQEDVLSAGIAIQHIWDSNYARTPEKDPEQITLTSASLEIDKTFSGQRLVSRWHGRYYEYAERSDLNATLHNGSLGWRSQWGSRFKTELEWKRDSYPVDQLEFRDKDIVKRDDVKAKAGYGAGHNLTVSVGARQTSQSHTNELREGLDFEEDEGFLEAAYQTGIKSTLAARVKYGERVYPEEQLAPIPDGAEIISGDLDFDYEQVELESEWIASPKTSISTTLAYFNRKGIVNDNSGVLVSAGAEWEMTPKVQLSGGYTFQQPAAGETSDSPTDIHLLFFDVNWQWTSKISLATGARMVEHRYEGSSPGPERNETLYSATPIMMIYDPTESFSIQLKTGWMDRESPLAHRNYTSTETSLGAFLRY